MSTGGNGNGVGCEDMVAAASDKAEFMAAASTVFQLWIQRWHG